MSAPLPVRQDYVAISEKEAKFALRLTCALTLSKPRIQRWLAPSVCFRDTLSAATSAMTSQRGGQIQ